MKKAMIALACTSALAFGACGGGQQTTETEEPTTTGDETTTTGDETGYDEGTEGTDGMDETGTDETGGTEDDMGATE